MQPDLLAAYQADVHKIANYAYDLPPSLNWAMGLAGEAIELLIASTALEKDSLLPVLPDDVLKEAGDVAWYTSENACLLEVSLAELAGRRCRPTLDRDEAIVVGILRHAGAVLELRKKEFFHGKARDDDAVIGHLGSIWYLLDLLGERLGSLLEDICAQNIAKLAARHPAGTFSSAYLTVQP